MSEKNQLEQSLNNSTLPLEDEKNNSDERKENINLSDNRGKSETSVSFYNEAKIEKMNLPWYKKLALRFDIFAFLPVPKSQPISTKYSIFASLLFIFIILSYAIYSFVMFLTNNVPSASRYYTPLPNTKFESPQFAVGFFYGDDKLEPFDISDGTYFTLGIYQQYRQLDDEPDKVPLDTAIGKACNFEWLQGSINTSQMLCPDYTNIVPEKDNNGKKVIIQGNAGFDAYMYPQILIQYCNSKERADCKSTEELRKIVAGGRIQLYLQNSAQKNYSTGKVSNTIPYQMYYYFLVPGKYQRYNLIYQLQNVHLMPDYLTSFSEKIENTFYIQDQIFYPTTNVYDPNRGFSVWMTLNGNVMEIQYSYETIIEVISMLGALSSVIFSAFAIIFIRYNANLFYAKNQKWDDIAPTMKELKTFTTQIDNNGSPQTQTLQGQPQRIHPQKPSDIELITSTRKD